MSTHWATAWNNDFLPVINRKRLLIACALDGVIAPATDSIAEAELFERTIILLRKISLFEGVTLVFISSRELADLKGTFNIKGAAYSGNGGMQIETTDLQWESAEARTHRSILCAAREDLQIFLKRISGVRVDDRQFSLSINYKSASGQYHKIIEEAVTNTAEKYPDLQIAVGGKNWVLRPRLAINSGAALRYLVERSTLEPEDVLIIGAEDTDPSTFEVFKDSVTVQIGEAAHGHARFRANDANDVAEFLFCLYVARKGLQKPSPPSQMRKLSTERTPRVSVSQLH